MTLPTPTRAILSNVWGKLAAASLAFAFVVFMLRFPPWFLYTAYIASTIVIFISLFSYGTDVIRALRETT